MTPQSPIDLTLLTRYLDGTASAEERVAIDAWIGDAPGRREALEALKTTWTADAARLKARYDTDAGWADLLTRLGAPCAPRFRVAPAAIWKRVGWAAVILAAAGAGAKAWLTIGKPAPRPTAQAPAMREYATPRGRRAVFRLLDGTEITLNADSRLRVPAVFGGTDRQIYLDGEAYFSVVHDSTRPFVVHTAHGTVRDVGTRFGVRAYADATAERVAVAEGSVAVVGSAAVKAGAAETPLGAGQVGAISRTGHVNLIREASVRDELAWTEGRLVLKGVPLTEAARRIGRWYDLDVQVADGELAARPVSGSYSNEPIAEVLTLITAAVGARYEWRGRSVLISTATSAR
jgi:transmembrane sensor